MKVWAGEGKEVGVAAHPREKHQYDTTNGNVRLVHNGSTHTHCLLRRLRHQNYHVNSLQLIH